MKKIITITLLLFLLLFSYSSQSQVSGYMGKRNIIKLGLFMKSTFLMPNRNGESGYFNFNDRYSIEYERVITRNKSIQFRATTFETLYKTKKYIWGYTEFDPSDPYLKMSCKTFGADFIFYQPLHIAPLGAYSSLGFDVIMTTADVDTAIINSFSDYGMYYPYYTKTNFTATHLGLNIKTGVKQIFFNCLSVDVNFQMGVIFSGNLTGTAEFNNDAEEYLRARIGNRLWGHYSWGVNCSVGYLF